MRNESVRAVVSGSAWMGSGLGSIESALYHLFARADNEVLIVAYAIGSTTTTFFQQLVHLLQRGIRVRMVMNRFSLQPLAVQQKLIALQKDQAHLLQLVSFAPQSEEADLHAKVIVVDRDMALVGSANLSHRGFLDNHELSVIVEGAAAAEIARAIDVLCMSPYATPVHSL
jgi:phosphatidylserine/phosphatidylglycerophosphate/cardiolipin synthase-like enzyme